MNGDNSISIKIRCGAISTTLELSDEMVSMANDLEGMIGHEVSLLVTEVVAHRRKVDSEGDFWAARARPHVKRRHCF